MPMLSAALPSVPTAITNALEQEFGELESRFSRHDWGPSELNGGRFAEALLRYLEWKDTGGVFTPIGTQLDRLRIQNGVANNSSLPDGIRFGVSRAVDMLLDIRNKRDVAHLGTTIDVNEMDSRLVMRISSWALAELVREEAGLSASDSQVLIDRLSERRIPLVEEVGGDLIVVATNLSAGKRALVALHKKYPKPTKVADLQSSVKYSHSTRFRGILEAYSRDGLVHLKDGNAYLTGKGVSWVDKNIPMKLEL